MDNLKVFACWVDVKIDIQEGIDLFIIFEGLDEIKSDNYARFRNKT